MLYLLSEPPETAAARREVQFVERARGFVEVPRADDRRSSIDRALRTARSTSPRRKSAARSRNIAGKTHVQTGFLRPGIDN